MWKFQLSQTIYQPLEDEECEEECEECEDSIIIINNDFGNVRDALECEECEEECEECEKNMIIIGNDFGVY